MATVLKSEPWNDGSGLITLTVDVGNLRTIELAVHQRQMDAPDWPSTLDTLVSRVVAESAVGR